MRTIKRALISGGAGFVGSHLCEQLLRDGVSVVCLDNLCTGLRSNIELLEEHPDFRWIDHDAVEPWPELGDFDLVAHLACPASPVDYAELGIETLRVGSEGTRHALDVALSKGARFLLASTSEVYGDPTEHPQRETYWGNVNSIGPRSVYDESKRFSEAITVAYRRYHGVDTTIARIFNTYGPRMRPDDGRMIPTFIHQALTNRPLTVSGSGQQSRSICHVTDTVRGLSALAHSHHEGPVNIGNPIELSVWNVATKILESTGSSSPIEYHDAVIDDPQKRCPDITLARSELGWEPLIGADEGLASTIEWFRSGLAVSALESNHL